MAIADQEIVQDQNLYINSIKQLLKADKWLQSGNNDIHYIKQQLYNQLQVVNVSDQEIKDGSLFRQINDYSVKGPSVLLIFDERLEEPIVQICDDNLQQQLQGLTQITSNFIKYNSEQYDQILNNDQQQKNSRQIQFFTSQYPFSYNLPLKVRQIAKTINQMSTVDYLRRKVTKDSKIMSTANQAKLDRYQLDSKKMLPSQIERQLQRQCQETHFVINLNQRQLYSEQRFIRLRVLNGQNITVSDYDTARQLYLQKYNMNKQMRMAAQPLQSNLAKLPIMTYSEKAENNNRISGQAAIDLRTEASAININKEVSETIRKRQIYDRVIKHNKIECQKARLELQQFIQSGQLQDNDQQYQMTQLLRQYDEETDPDLSHFVQQCEQLQQEYALDRKKREQEDEIDDGIVDNPFNVIQKRIDQLSQSEVINTGIEADQTDEYKKMTIAQKYQLEQSKKQKQLSIQRSVIQNQQSVQHLSSIKTNDQLTLSSDNMQDLAKEDLEPIEQDEEKQTLLSLSQITKSLGVNHRDFEAKRQNAIQEKPIQNDNILKDQRKSANDRIFDIESAIIQSQMSEDRDIQQKPVQQTSLVKSQVMQKSNLTTMMSQLKEANPIQQVQQNTRLYIDADEYKPDPIIAKSNIYKNSVLSTDPEKAPLPLETGSIQMSDMKTLPKEVIQNAQGLEFIKPEQLLPGFDELLQQELVNQKESNDLLFKSVSENVDPTIRYSLMNQKQTFRKRDVIQENRQKLTAEDPQKSTNYIDRHTVMLDVVNQGDLLRNAPHRVINKSSRKFLNFTTQEHMETLEDQLMRQNIFLEKEKSSSKNSSNTIKQMQKHIAEDILNQQLQEKRKQHLDNLKLIQTEKPMPQYYIKPSPYAEIEAKDERKVRQIMQRNKLANNREKLPDNEQNDNEARNNVNSMNNINKMSSTSNNIQSSALHVLHVESLEQAVEAAKHMKIGPGELMDAGSQIVAKSKNDVKRLQNYENQFINNEMRWDQLQKDEVYKLLRSGTKLLQSSQNLQTSQQLVASAPVGDEDKLFASSLSQGRSFKFIDRSNSAKQIAEDILDKIGYQTQ